MGHGTHGSLAREHRSMHAAADSSRFSVVNLSLNFVMDFPMDFLVDCFCVFSIGFTTLLSTGKIHTEKLINVFCVRLERRPEQKSTEKSFGHLGGEKKNHLGGEKKSTRKFIRAFGW